MKNLSKVVQLALLSIAMLMGQQVLSGSPKPKTPVGTTTAGLQDTYRNQQTQQQKLEQQKKVAAEQQRIQQEATRISGIPPSAPLSTTRSSLYPPLNEPTPSSASGTPSTNLPPRRMASSDNRRRLTPEERNKAETAAQYIKNIWFQYYLVMQAIPEKEDFPAEDWDIILRNLAELQNTIKELNNPELSKLYTLITQVFNSENVYSIETVAAHLYNLITAINQFAGTSYDLTDIAQYIAIEGEENPLYSAYERATGALYGLANPITSAWTSAKQAAASTWDYAKQGTQYIKSFIGQPSKEEFDDATYRLSKIKEMEQTAKERELTQSEADILSQYKLIEPQDRAMVAKWWPYLVSVAAVGGFYYMFPEFSKSVAGAGMSAAGYVAKPALGTAAAYGGYKLWKSEAKPAKRTKTTVRPTQAN
jgi:hypothetical protein